MNGISRVSLWNVEKNLRFLYSKLDGGHTYGLAGDDDDDEDESGDENEDENGDEHGTGESDKETGEVSGENGDEEEEEEEEEAGPMEYLLEAKGDSMWTVSYPDSWLAGITNDVTVDAECVMASDLFFFQKKIWKMKEKIVRKKCFLFASLVWSPRGAEQFLRHSGLLRHGTASIIRRICSNLFKIFCFFFCKFFSNDFSGEEISRRRDATGGAHFGVHGAESIGR